MSAQFQCPQCSAVFPYSPNLDGRKVRCKSCQHIFVVTAPAEPVVAKAVAEPSPRVPAPPPLPPKSTGRRPADDDRPTPGSRADQRFKNRHDEEEEDDAARDRPAAEFEPSGGIGILLLLIAGCAVAFLLVAVVIGYILWPSSTPRRAAAPSSPVAILMPAVSAPVPLPDPAASATLSRTLPPDLRPRHSPTVHAEPTKTALSRLQVTA